MPYFALNDTDWSWDDQDEARTIVVAADTPEEAVEKATEILIEEHGEGMRQHIDGGVTWKVSQLVHVGFQSVTWEKGKPDFSDVFVNYPEGANSPLVHGNSNQDPE